MTYDSTDSDADGVVESDIDNDKIDTNEVNAQSVDAEQQTINEFSLELEKTSEQSISANTETTIDWDSQDLDANLYDYDSSTDEVTVNTAGDFRVDVGAELRSLNDQTRVLLIIKVNGTPRKEFQEFSSGPTAAPEGSRLVRGLASGDKITIDVEVSDAADLKGFRNRTTATISKEG